MDTLTRFFLTTALTLLPLMAMEHPDDQQTTAWSKLSSELKVEIASYLLPSDAARASLVHSDWHTHVDHDMAWKQRIRNDFPSYQGQKAQEKSWKDIYRQEFDKELERTKALIKKWQYGWVNSLVLREQNIHFLPSDFWNIIPSVTSVVGLTSNHLKSLPPITAELNELYHLILGNNKLQALPESLSKLRNLTMLNVKNNQLRTLPESLSNLKMLERLYIEGNPLDPICVSKYLKAAPIGISVRMSLNLAQEILANDNLGLGNHYIFTGKDEPNQTATIQKVS